MAVEVYMVESAEKIIADTDGSLEKWKEIAQKCGLTGQSNLLGKSPVPFRAMSREEDKVYHTLCPSYTKLEDFDKEMIPLRVMELISLSKAEGYFDFMEVWHDIGKPDPILVGYKGSSRWSFTSRFIVARWGDELRSYAELKKMAIERKTAELFRNAVDVIEHQERIKANPQQYAIADIERG